MHCVVSESSAWSTTWARWELWCPSVSGGTRPVLSSRAVSMGFEDDWNEDNNDNMHSDERSTAILVWYDVVLYMYLAHMWFFWYFSLHVTIKWHEEHEYLVEMLKGVRVKHTCNILPWKTGYLIHSFVGCPFDEASRNKGLQLLAQQLHYSGPWYFFAWSLGVRVLAIAWANSEVSNWFLGHPIHGKAEQRNVL